MEIFDYIMDSSGNYVVDSSGNYVVTKVGSITYVGSVALTLLPTSEYLLARVYYGNIALDFAVISFYHFRGWLKKVGVADAWQEKPKTKLNWEQMTKPNNPWSQN